MHAYTLGEMRTRDGDLEEEEREDGSPRRLDRWRENGKTSAYVMNAETGFLITFLLLFYDGKI